MERRVKKKVGEGVEEMIGLRCLEDLRCRFGALVVTKASRVYVEKKASLITLTDIKDIDDDDEDDHITLTVQSQCEEDVYDRIGKHMKLGFLMDDYCERKDDPTIRFLNSEGDRLREHQTPEQLGMQDGDLIDAFSWMVGGYN